MVVVSRMWLELSTPWTRLPQGRSRSHSVVRIGSTLWKGPFDERTPQRRAICSAALRTGIVMAIESVSKIGTFGPVTVSVPRARLVGTDGRTSEWRNRTIPAYKRLTRRAEALIAATYLAGTNTRRARRWPRCSAARSARDRSAGPGTRSKPTGRRGSGAIILA